MVKEIKIENSLGLHARLCSAVAKEAGKFAGDIYFYTRNHKIDAKSILGLLSLCCPAGSDITVEATGKDAEAAIDIIAGLLG